jgi:hypothetical protein
LKLFQNVFLSHGPSNVDRSVPSSPSWRSELLSDRNGMQDVEEDQDPVEAADSERDLYGISTWERRSLLDSASVAVYWLAVRAGQVLLVLLALSIFVAVGGLSMLREPSIGVLTILSALPALVLAGYVWYSDVTTNEPLSLLAATFILSTSQSILG